MPEFLFKSINDLASLTAVYILETDLMNLLLQRHYDNDKNAVFDNIEIVKHIIEVEFGVKFEKCERCYAYRHKESLCDLYRVIPYQWDAKEQIKQYQIKHPDGSKSYLKFADDIIKNEESER